MKKGTYRFNRGDFSDLSISIAEMEINISFPDETSETSLNVIGGTLDIDRNGTSYILDFNLDLMNEQKITGSYTGTLREFDARGDF